MLYEKLKNIENLIEGNEYFDGGVSYCVTFDVLDNSLSFDFAIKNRLLEMKAIKSSENNMVITPIKQPKNEMKNLCDKWHIDEQVCNELLCVIDDDTKLYKCCDDYEYISYGTIGEIFRILESGQEKVLVDFYISD